MISKIHPSAIIHPNVWINPYNVIIEKGVEIEANSCIGSRAIVAPREFKLFGKRKLDKSNGQLIIKEDVHIGALNSIHLAHTEGSSTLIEKNVITGARVAIGHDCVIGEESMVLLNAVLPGHVTVGKRCWIGPGAVFRDSITIGDEAIVSMGSVVTKDVPPNKTVTGNFAIDHDVFLKHLKSKFEKE